MKQPKPHQKEALAAISRGLKKHDRGQVLMACGSGKSLVALWAAEESGAEKILVLIPSLALLSQSLKVFRDNHSWPNWRALAVCCDETVSEDSVRLSPSEIECPVTSKAEDVEAFLKHRGVCVVFSTYHSAHLLGGTSFDLGIFDEAHKTSGLRGKPFGFALSDDNVKINKRLFFTATPRVSLRNSNDAWQLVHSMDDPRVYGPAFFELSFRQAVDRGIVCDYRIVVSEVHGNPDVDHRLATQVALTKAMAHYGVTKVFTFHNTVAAASAFTGAGFPPGVKTLHVCGKQPSNERRRTMEAFETAPRAVMTNARCLTEGVDVPAVGMVAFVHPRRAVIEVVQAAGRACRLAEGKRVGYIFLPLFRDVLSNETLEQATERQQFRNVLDVLQAMSTQDEVLQDFITRVREARAVGGDLEAALGGEPLPGVEFHAAEGVNSLIALRELQRVVTVALLTGLAGNGRDSVTKKELLLKWARAGRPRPSYTNLEERPLWNALQTYTRPEKAGSDPAFNAKIRKARPDWFLDGDRHKARFLKMAAAGEPRPKYSFAVDRKELLLAGRLAYHLQRDPAFAAELARLNPSWVVKTSAVNKQRLLEMATAGEPRPNKRSKDPEIRRWGVLLHNYCSPASDSFDPDFRKQIEAAGWKFASGSPLELQSAETP